jgi:hypothetical protein|tara:strand:+ start:252 stop:581 length:330 start_codon:yes stop_codon:yes gene_type:complete
MAEMDASESMVAEMLVQNAPILEHLALMFLVANNALRRPDLDSIAERYNAEPHLVQSDLDICNQVLRRLDALKDNLVPRDYPHLTMFIRGYQPIIADYARMLGEYQQGL